MRVFLGGTVNGSRWRNTVKEKLTIDYFDPVVENWNEAAYERELSERRFCDYLLYVLTPKMTGFYAIAEVTDDSYHRPDRTIYCYLPEDDGEEFTKDQLAEFERLGHVVTENGARWLKNLDEIIAFLNSATSVQKYDDAQRFDAFISFGKQESGDFAHQILNRLSENKWDVYMDRNDIPLMIENEEFVFGAILRSDNFIYVISPNTIRSEYCKKELEFAIRFNKRIIPVLHRALGHDEKFLDEIVANKSSVSIENPEENVSGVITAIEKILRTDMDYVRLHSKYLFQARKWDLKGRKNTGLLFGPERKKALNWLAQKSDSLIPMQLHIEYIQASRKMPALYFPLLWLHERTHAFTHLKRFDQAAMIISLISPIAMADQVRQLVFSDNPDRYHGISLPMWLLFFLIQITLLFVGIKQKDLRMFVSMVLSLLVSSTVIALVLVNR